MTEGYFRGHDVPDAYNEQLHALFVTTMEIADVASVLMTAIGAAVVELTHHAPSDDSLRWFSERVAFQSSQYSWRLPNASRPRLDEMLDAWDQMLQNFGNNFVNP